MLAADAAMLQILYPDCVGMEDRVTEIVLLGMFDRERETVLYFCTIIYS